MDRMFLEELFRAAVHAADPKAAMRAFLPEKPKGRVVIVGAGKGAAQMAAAFENLWDGPIEGVVVTRYGFATPCRHVSVIEAAHPVPDENGLKASHALLDAVSNLNEDDLVIALICGGGSALLPQPPEGFTLSDEQALNEALLASGAPIGVMNTIRKHFSLIKGGRLAQAAYPAKLVSLVVSDVPGDNPAEVASGPTIPSATRRADCMKLIENYGITLPAPIANFLTQAPETPHPDDPKFFRNENYVIASARLSLEAAARAAEARGVNAVILSDAIEGEARDVGRVHAAIAREIVTQNRPFTKPIVMLSGGETTVTLRGSGGRGGRNSEFLLAFASAIDGLEGIKALAADTDGIDGSENNAGAFADGASAERMRTAGVDPLLFLQRNDAWGAFNAVKDLFEPGPTGTNVNDFRAIYIAG